MAIISQTVDQLATSEQYVKFEGLERLDFVVTLPDWHEPFPTQVRSGAANPRQLQMHGLLHVSKAWYINGPVVDQWTISGMIGAIKVPAGTRIESEQLPEQWEANAKPMSTGSKEWHAYSNGRTTFC